MNTLSIERRTNMAHILAEAVDPVLAGPVITTFDQWIVNFLNSINPNGIPVGNLILVAVALLLSVVLCGVIGIEREFRGRSAGLRTHLLVGLGSCIIMIISIYGFPAIFAAHRDTARLAASIITGVGFLGAGAIMHRNNGVKGLTTAGTIWIVMAIGIACGSFNFLLAIGSTLIIFLVLTLFKGIEKRIGERNLVVTMIAPSEAPVVSKILKVAKEYNAEIHGLSSELVDEKGEEVKCTFQVIFGSAIQARPSEFVSRLKEETSATSVELLNEH